MGPLLALQRAYRRDASVTCLILRLAGDVVEAHVSFLQARGSPVAGQRCKGSHRLLWKRDTRTSRRGEVMVMGRSGAPLTPLRAHRRGGVHTHRLSCPLGPDSCTLPPRP